MERVFVAIEQGKVVDISGDGENIVEGMRGGCGWTWMNDLEVLATTSDQIRRNGDFQPKKKDLQQGAQGKQCYSVRLCYTIQL